ncbi:MAG: hypothetical protein ACI4OT_02235 [Bacilli bacterium]
MKYKNGKEFLNKMYTNMYLEETVKSHTTNKDTPAGKIGKYIERLDRIHKEAKDNERKLHVLKEFYYDKYIIKELPENYINLQKRILRERGYGNIEINSTQKEEWLNQVREEQKHSLDTWIDYLISDDRVYPMWFKNYAFRGMITLNKYDKEKESFGKRTNTTTEPFVELNREALSLVYDILKREIGENNLTEEQEELLTKGESFKKLYTYYYINTLPKDIDKETEGIWKKYNQGENYQELWKSLQGKNTGWCTAGEETCKNQIKGGDFYVYYTKDEEGNYTNPRIAIRMEGTEEIGEVRGIGKAQNLEDCMTDIAEEKLKEFPNHEQYNKKVRDMKILTEIDHKQERKEELTKEELEFLYEIEEKIEGFGYEEDPRIKEIIEKRNKRKDLAYIFNCKENEVAFTEEDLRNNKCIVAYGFDSNEEDIDYIKDLKYFKGNIDLDVLTSAENLVLPKEIGGDIRLNNLTSAEHLVLPKKIGGSLYLNSLTSAENLILPEKIGRHLNLDRLTSAEHLVLPEKIGEDLQLSSLTSAEHLVLPKIINGNLSLACLTNINNLVLPKTISGYLSLIGLTSVENLVLPKKIGGGLWLICLNSSETLVLPESYIYTKVYTSAKLSYVPDEEYFNKEKKKIKKIN